MDAQAAAHIDMLVGYGREDLARKHHGDETVDQWFRETGTERRVRVEPDPALARSILDALYALDRPAMRRLREQSDERVYEASRVLAVSAHDGNRASRAAIGM